MSHPLRVLSIDFDVFQTIPDAEIFSAFPDGVDLPQVLSCITWAHHYADPAEEKLLNQISINQDMLQQAVDLIKQGCTCCTPTLIVNSHIHIYDWIFQHYNDTYDAIDITHLDMHHDMFNNNTELDCGNWISHVKQDVPNTHVKWICNPITKQMYDITGPEFDNITDDIKPLIGNPFDILFICRSDNWLPPHLDQYFSDFCHEILHTVENARAETDIMDPRDITPLVEQTRNLLKKLI